MSLYRQINRNFRSRGLSLRGDAAKVLYNHLIHMDELDNIQEEIANIVRNIKEIIRADVKVVDLDTINRILNDSQQQIIRNNNDYSSQENPLRVIDAFQLPKLEYDKVRKTFVRSTVALSIHAGASAKIEVFRKRYTSALQRVRRHFSRPSLLSGDEEEIHITEPGSLLGKSGEQFVFGLLSQLQEGQLCIEDLNTHIPIQLERNVNMTPGLFTEGCMVLAQGYLDDDIFRIKELVFPPAETRDSTLKEYPIFELFGLPEFKPGDRMLLKEKSKKLNSDEHMIIVLSDVWLDKTNVFKKLKVLFNEFNNMVPPPPVFVLMGNFTSKDYRNESNQIEKISGYFDKLARLLQKCSNLVENSHFVFIPGPHDPGYGQVLPRPGLPNLYTERLQSTLNNITLASNPCRLLYYDHEMVFFRENLLHKVRRNCLFEPNIIHGNKDISKHLALTVTNQAHLSSLPFVKQPLYWDYDFAMNLYPLPDALILADEYKQYEWTTDEVGCDTFNPGQFGTDFSFVAYSPCKQLKSSNKSNDDDDDEDRMISDDDDNDDSNNTRVQFSRIPDLI